MFSGSGSGPAVFSTEAPRAGFFVLAGGVSGAESESGGDPGGEKGESGGEPGPESGESGGEPGGDSSGFSSSPVTRVVAELRREDPKLNIWEAAAGGFADSVNPPKPPNSFPVTDSSGCCLDAAGAGGFAESIKPPSPPKSFPVTDSEGCEADAGALTDSVSPPRLMPPKPPKKLDSCLALAGDGWGLDLGWIGRPVLGSILGDPVADEAGDRGEVGDFCRGVVGGVRPWSLVLCCLIRSLPGLPGTCLCGEGGAEPCLGLGTPGGSMPPIARCIWQLRQSHSFPAESGGLKPQRLHTCFLHSVQLL